MREKISPTFWKYVDKDGPIPEHMPDLGNCWVWTGAKNPYGTFTVDNQSHKAHRYIMGEPILFVLHKCDNPPCVNPDHLFLGTQGDNVRDAKAKGRLRKTNPSKRALSADQVRAIRKAYDTGTLNHTQLSALYGVSRSTVNYIVNKRYYRDID